MKLVIPSAMPWFASVFIGLGVPVEAVNVMLFPYCTETHQVDSSMFIQRSLGSEVSATPLFNGWHTRTYQPNSCIPATIRTRPMDWDRIFIDEVKPRLDGFMRYSGWEDTRNSQPGNWSREWYGPDGMVDSIFVFSDTNHFENLNLANQTMKRIQSPGLMVYETRIRDSVGTLALFSQDSVFTEGNKTTVHSLLDGKRSKTLCTDDGQAVTCHPESSGEAETKKGIEEVWYHTGDRVDSVLYLDSSQSLIVKEWYFWSERKTSTLRSVIHSRHRIQSRFQLKSVPVNALGQRRRIPSREMP